MVARLARFGLEIEPTKTKVLGFGPQEAERCKRAGKTKPETFDFLGFTHYCGRSRNGKRFRMKRITARKKLLAKVAEYTQWLKKHRAEMNNQEVWKHTQEKVRGHYQYYGITDNAQGIIRYGYEVKRILLKWLNRQGGKQKMNWKQFTLMEQRFPFPKPRIRVNLLPAW